MIQILSEFIGNKGDISTLDGVPINNAHDATLHYCAREHRLYIFGWDSGSGCGCGESDKHRTSYVLYGVNRRGDIENLSDNSIVNRIKIDVPKISIVEVNGKVHRFGDKAKKQFYELFQIGVEVEGEYKHEQSTIEEKSDGYFSEEKETLKGDGSISCRSDGYDYELVSPVITSLKEEEEFLTALNSLTKGSGFAYSNNTCGTHIHLDLKADAIAKLFPSVTFSQDRRAYHSYLLKLLDSVEFEKYFFQEYFRAFSLPKFWNRLRNDYCKTHSVVARERVISEVRPLDDVEQLKYGRGRYHWLNYECLERKAGIEFRIFPYITSTNGMREIIKFCQYVVISYWKKKASEERLQKIADYYNGKMAIQKSELDKYDAMLYSSFRAEGRNETQVSFDLIEFSSYLAKKYEKKTKRAERENGGKKKNAEPVSHPISTEDIPF